MAESNCKASTIFLLALCTYFAVICLNPSWTEASGLLTLIAGRWVIKKSDQDLSWISDPAFTALGAFALYSSAANALGSGEVARTGVIYGQMIPFLIGRAWALTRNDTLHKDMFAGAAALSIFVFTGQILLWCDLDRLEILAPALQDLRLTFRNAVRTALFVATGGLVCLSHMLPPASWRTRITATLTGSALMITLITTGKRTTLAALLLCVGCLLFTRGKKALITVILFSAIGLIFLLGKADRFIPAPEALIASQAERMAVWYAAIEIIKENPFTGSGFRTFKQVATPHVEAFRMTRKTQTAPYENLEDAHNLALHILSESGICGFIIFSLIFFFPLRHCWKLRTQNSAALPLLACLGLILLNSQLHVNLFSPNTGGLTFLLTGAASALRISRYNP